MKKIIFKKELYIKNEEIENYNMNNGWVDIVDDKEVNLFAIYIEGYPSLFFVSPEWCQEIDELDSEDEELERDPEEAFSNAIKKGLKNPDDYMYMYSNNNKDYFKHIDTREYIEFSYN